MRDAHAAEVAVAPSRGRSPQTPADRRADHTASVTGVLDAWSAGDPDALSRLLPLVYQHLRQIAARQLRRDQNARGLDPGDLVHALVVQLAAQRAPRWHDGPHFYAVATQMMRRLLVDHRRTIRSLKRGGGVPCVSLSTVDDSVLTADPPSAETLAVDEAVARLARRDPALARVVELRFFTGLSIEETAHLLGRSSRSIKRDWRLARAWLHRALRDH